LRILFSLKYADIREMNAGFVSIIKTLGWIDGLKAFISATGKHLADIRRGEGLYPEKGKRRVWFKLNFLKRIYEYLKKTDESAAVRHFDSIIKGPTNKFIGQFIPPPEYLTRDVVLHQVWQGLVKGDDNIVAEVCPPEGDSVSLLVRRCFINEVARDIGLLSVGDRICYGDYIFWENYHPNVKFSRTKTLMAGDTFCNHTLTWTKS